MTATVRGSILGKAMAALLMTVSIGVGMALPRSHAAAQDTRATVPPPSLEKLAGEARQAFHRRVEPLPVRLDVSRIGQREEGDAVRAHLLQSGDAAIDGLVDEASREPQRGAVERALREIARRGRSNDADALLAGVMAREAARGAEGARAAAAAGRHSVALGELPQALWVHIGTVTSDVGLYGRTGEPLGALALPAYRQAAEREPGNPWNWIVIAWLSAGDPRAAALALQQAEALASAELARDARARIEFHRQAARLAQRTGRPEDAQQMLQTGLAIAREAAARPGSGVDARAVTMAMNALGDFHAATGHAAAARALYASALALREERARSMPGSQAARQDLIASHVRLAALGAEPGARTPTVDHRGRAFDLYRALAEKDRFTPMLGPEVWPAMAFVTGGVGSLLTSVIGIVLLAAYRGRVGRLMRRASSGSGATASRPTQRHGPLPAALRLRVLDADAVAPSHAVGPGPGAGVARALRHAAWTQAAAALAFAAVAAMLFLDAAGIAWTAQRFAMFTTIHLWPVVFVFAWLWSGDRRRVLQVLGAYFALLAVEVLVFGLRMTTPAKVFGMTLPGPWQLLFLWVGEVWISVVLLFFLNRSVRAVGPVLLLFLTLVCAGAMAGQVLATSYAGMQWTARVQQALNLPLGTWAIPAMLLGVLAVAPLALLLVAGLRAGYRAKWIGSQDLVFDSIWLLWAVAFVLQHLVLDLGWQGWIGLTAYLAYRTVDAAGRWLRARAGTGRAGTRLLLLRVFGHRRRTERLFDVLSARWCHVGPIRMIAAPDLATSTIDADKLMDFLGGRLRRRFVIEPDDLARGIAGIDDAPDADGRFRVSELFCGDDAWRAAVKALMGRSDLVVMDLRGFDSGSRGCAFELQALLDIVPAERIVMLTDATTDQALLSQTLHDCAGRAAPGSPNRSGAPMTTLLGAGRHDIGTVNALLSLADERAGTPPAQRPAPAPAALLGLSGRFRQVSIPLPADGLTLGRDAADAGRLAFDEECRDVSRSHCAIRYDPGTRRFHVTDLGSSNGTFLMPGNRRLTAHETTACPAGQVVRLGHQESFELVAVLGTRPPLE